MARPMEALRASLGTRARARPTLERPAATATAAVVMAHGHRAPASAGNANAVRLRGPPPLLTVTTCVPAVTEGFETEEVATEPEQRSRLALEDAALGAAEDGGTRVGRQHARGGVAVACHPRLEGAVEPRV